MNRLPSWPERLAAFLDSRSRAPFVWGANDCCLFACDAVLQMTGTDIAAPLRGRYSTALGAARLLRFFGGMRGMASNFAEVHGIAQIPVKTARRGDVVLLEAPGRQDGQLNPQARLAVDLGGPSLSVVSMDGLSLAAAGRVGIPLRFGITAYRI